MFDNLSNTTMTLSAELFLHVYNPWEGACVRRSMCETQRLREDVMCGCCRPFLRCRRRCGSGSSPSLNTVASSYTPAIPHLTEESKSGRMAAWCRQNTQGSNTGWTWLFWWTKYEKYMKICEKYLLEWKHFLIFYWPFTSDLIVSL